MHAQGENICCMTSQFLLSVFLYIHVPIRNDHGTFSSLASDSHLATSTLVSQVLSYRSSRECLKARLDGVDAERLGRHPLRMPAVLPGLGPGGVRSETRSPPACVGEACRFFRVFSCISFRGIVAFSILFRSLRRNHHGSNLWNLDQSTSLTFTKILLAPFLAFPLARAAPYVAASGVSTVLPSAPRGSSTVFFLCTSCAPPLPFPPQGVVSFSGVEHWLQRGRERGWPKRDVFPGSEVHDWLLWIHLTMRKALWSLAEKKTVAWPPDCLTYVAIWPPVSKPSWPRGTCSCHSHPHLCMCETCSLDRIGAVSEWYRSCTISVLVFAGHVACANTI